MAATTALPVLDMTAYRSDPTSPEAAAFVEELRRVTHEIGFFYVVGHGVDEALNEEVHDVARTFFALPEEDRLSIENVLSPQFRGYTKLGHEYTNARQDLRDQIDIAREEAPPRNAPGDPAWLRLRGPNLWPEALPELRPVMTAWMEQAEGAAATLLRAMAEALGQRADYFDEVVTPHAEILTKVIHYPAPAENQTDQGVGHHRDTGFITFIHQDDVGGLQVELGDAFVEVPRVPGAFVVNLGEMFQLVTSGYFKATVHKVVSPPAGVERISVAYFYNPKLEATLTAVSLPPQLAAEAPGGASADSSNPILANYGDNSMKVRLRAHPDVAERHHADLLDRV